jgi:hypothetical protein
MRWRKRASNSLESTVSDFMISLLIVLFGGATLQKFLIRIFVDGSFLSGAPNVTKTCLAQWCVDYGAIVS